MPDENKPNTPQEFEAVRSEKFLSLYSNSANTEVTVWDFKIIFGELKKLADKTVIEQSVAITMSPQHAKVLAAVLLNNVKEYEKNVGEIKLPEQVPSIKTQ